MDVPLANTSNPEHYNINKRSMNFMSKLFSHGDKNGLVNILFTFTYLSFTYRQHVDGALKLLQWLLGCTWSNSGDQQGLSHTHRWCV